MFPRLVLLLFLSALPLSAVDLTIVRVFTGWRDGASFKRISEYFDGKENTGDATILRTHPEQRTGYYFLLRVTNPGAPLKAKFQLQLISSGAPVQPAVVFPAEIAPGSGVYQLGLTGPEWQNPKSQPVAWQVQVVADDGRVLASEKSYLWEKPAAK